MSQRFKVIVASTQGELLQNPKHVEFADRGFHYGDGCFTTMYCEQSRIALFDSHIVRLIHDATRLKITLDEKPLRQQLITALTPHLSNNKHCLAVKIIVSRGVGGRGYEPPTASIPNIYISFHECDKFVFTQSNSRVPSQYKIQPCSFPLAKQAILAGIKHLNRLEQVIAKHELQELNSQHLLIDDLLMLDEKQNLVECTAGNIFFFADNAWHTPELNNAGVAGVMRSTLIEFMHNQDIKINISRYKMADLAKAESLFVCNAIKHFIPISELQASSVESQNQCYFTNAKAEKLFVDFNSYLSCKYTEFTTSIVNECK